MERDEDFDLFLERVPLTGKCIRVPLRFCELLGEPPAQNQHPLVSTGRLQAFLQTTVLQVCAPTLKAIAVATVMAMAMTVIRQFAV
jgi:cobalamin biosynthesis protein CobD/CbiB